MHSVPLVWHTIVRYYRILAHRRQPDSVLDRQTSQRYRLKQQAHNYTLPGLDRVRVKEGIYVACKGLGRCGRIIDLNPYRELLIKIEGKLLAGLGYDGVASAEQVEVFK